MNIHDIINILEAHIRKDAKEKRIDFEGHIVLHNTKESDASFKAYKTYTSSVCLVLNKKIYTIIKVQTKQRLLTGQKDDCILDMINKEIMDKIFTLVSSDSYKKIVEGNYEYTC